MPVLFALSILAFVAFLWATISIAGFVRRTRRQRNHREEVKAGSIFPLSDSLTPTTLEPIVPPVPQAPPPPRPSDTGVTGKPAAQPESAFYLSEDEIPASVDGVALPHLHSETSLGPPPKPGSLPTSIHSDGIH